MKFTREQKIEALHIGLMRFNYRSADPYAGICGALPYTPAGNYIRKYISKQLGGENTYLFHWLERHRPHVRRCPDNLKRIRIQWIKWMITNAT